MAAGTAPAKPSGLLKWGFNLPILLLKFPRFGRHNRTRRQPV